MNIHAGRSADGIDWEIDEQPIVFAPADARVAEIQETFVHAYDPRVVWIEDRYYVTWCNGYHGPTIGVAYTHDFETFTQLDNSYLPFNRNGVLFPRRIGGNYAMLSRPSDNGHTPFGDIFYSESPDLTYWGRHRHVMGTRSWSWDSTKVGAGPIPIETDEGWLVIYHGVLTSCNGFVYSMGAALLDLDEPWRVLARAGGLPPLAAGAVRASRRRAERGLPVCGTRRPGERPPHGLLRRRGHRRLHGARPSLRGDGVAASVTGAPSARTRVKRGHERAAYDRATIDAILDAALVCHLGFERDGQPFVIPTLHARIGDLLYVHGSSASRTVRALGEGIPACVTVTLLDGIVLARSVFEHSMNYRSVVVLGTATPVTDPDEKNTVLEAFTEKLLPGRWADARPPSAQGAEGDRRALAADRRGVGEGADGWAGRRRHTGRRARRLGGSHPARPPRARRRFRRRISGRGFAVPAYARRYRAARPHRLSQPRREEEPEHDRERHELDPDPERRGSARARRCGAPSSRGSGRRSRSGR